MILHDIDFNPYNDKQAEDRSHRVGQTRYCSCSLVVIETDPVKLRSYQTATIKLFTSPSIFPSLFAFLQSHTHSIYSPSSFCCSPSSFPPSFPSCLHLLSIFLFQPSVDPSGFLHLPLTLPSIPFVLLPSVYPSSPFKLPTFPPFIRSLPPYPQHY